MARPRKQSVKEPGTAVRLEPDEKRYLLEGAKKESPPGVDMGLSTFLRTAAHRRTTELLGVDFEGWKKRGRKENGR